jgi:hypothetical protein
MDQKRSLSSSADDIALTAGYWDTVLKQRVPEPEGKLMRAILRLALLDFMKHYRHNDACFRDARKWLFEQSNDDRFLGFEAVCSVLGLSAMKIRALLQQWRIKQRRTDFDDFLPNKHLTAF